MSEQKIKLYKQRDFSQKMNVTIDYLRDNFKVLIQATLIVVVPFSLLFIFVFLGLYESLGSMIEESNYQNSMSSVLVYSFLMAVVFTYMKEKDAGNDHSPLELLKISLRYVPGLIAIIVISSIVSIVGIIFLIIPGIYLIITMSLASPIYVFENVSIGEAIKKSFKLINGKWWSTFGLLFVSGLIAIVVGLVFSIPTYVLMFGKVFTNLEETAQNPQSIYEAFESWYGSLSWAISMIGSNSAYIIPIIALSFQYFNLSERMEGTGLKSEIDNFENLG